MQVLGHSQISLTLGTYSQVVPELAHAAADRMGAALWGVEATTVAPDNRRRRGLRDEPAAEGQWGGWGSNPRPADYEHSAGTAPDLGRRPRKVH